MEEYREHSREHSRTEEPNHTEERRMQKKIVQEEFTTLFLYTLPCTLTLHTPTRREEWEEM